MYLLIPSTKVDKGSDCPSTVTNTYLTTVSADIFANFGSNTVTILLQNYNFLSDKITLPYTKLIFPS
jgi:hypothetical protein